ncbi:MAG: branched-chain amino acid ABC transporter substrate-binding protein [Chloroflexota bacterium]
MKRFLLVLALVSALVLLALPTVVAQDACDDEIGCVVIGPNDPVVIGSMLTVSGPTAFLGEDSLGGIELAILQRGEELMGREIELIEEDSLCTAEGGQQAAQRIAADESVLGVVGTSCSSAGVAALPIISEAGMLMISPTNTGPVLTNANEEEGGVYQAGYFRTAHNDLFQGSLAAEFAFNELGSMTLATVHDGSPYADGLQEVMAEVFAELGGEVVFQGAVNVGDTDMTAILTEIAASAPDVLYFPLFEPESNFMAAQAKEIPGLENTILMGADASFADSFPENTGDAAVGMYFSSPFVSPEDEDYSAFLALWDEEIGGVPPSGFHAHAYDATNILLDAIEFAAVEDGDNLVVGRQALRDAVAATEMFDGLTGVLTCQEESPFSGDCATGEALAIFQITEAEVNDNAWPPPVVFLPSADMDDMDMEDEDMDDEGEEESSDG